MNMLFFSAWAVASHKSADKLPEGFSPPYKRGDKPPKGFSIPYKRGDRPPEAFRGP
jgi:hypothetical protein